MAVAVPTKILCDKRLTLRPIDLEQDAPEWYVAMPEPEMHVWTGNRIPEDMEEVRHLLAGYMDHPDIWAWCMRDRPSGSMVGTYWLAVPYEFGGKRISVDAQRIAKPYWRTGRTMAARRLVYRYAFEDLGIDEIHASAWEANMNSCQSMEHAGWDLVEVKPRQNPKYGKELPERHYVFDRGEMAPPLPKAP